MTTEGGETAQDKEDADRLILLVCLQGEAAVLETVFCGALCE